MKSNTIQFASFLDLDILPIPKVTREKKPSSIYFPNLIFRSPPPAASPKAAKNRLPTAAEMARTMNTAVAGDTVEVAKKLFVKKGK